MARVGGVNVLRVAQDGSGQYSRVQDAIDAVPFCNKERIVIEVLPGVYRQPIYVPKTKNLITLRGFCAEETVLTWNNTASRIDHHQGSGQAVAIRVTADRCAFYSCRFLGWQDTAYLHYGKHYLRDCYIEGSVDFIFGNATALLEHCHIHCKSQGYITAHSRKSAQESTGYVFLRCVITGNGGKSYMYLGRPWAPFARVVFAYTWMDACIRSVGWNNWNKPENERSACFYEYRCSGPGSNPSERINWARQLMEDEAAQFVTHGFIDPDQQKAWLTKNTTMIIPLSAQGCFRLLEDTSPRMLRY